jgi:hypothetical protein
MEHFRPLDRCECGAYRYLAAREHGKSFEVVEIHQTPQGKRNYRKVAGFPKSALAWHDPRNNGSREGDSFDILTEKLRTNAKSILGLVTQLESRDKRSKEEAS